MKNAVAVSLLKDINKFLMKKCFIVNFKHESIFEYLILGFNINIWKNKKTKLYLGEVICIAGDVEPESNSMDFTIVLKEFTIEGDEQIVKEPNVLLFDKKQATNVLNKYKKAKALTTDIY